MQKTLPRHMSLANSRLLKVALAVCILTVSAKVTVPFFPVPMTMQVAAVLLIGGIGGLQLGAVSMLAYLMAGAAGLPVFAGTPEKGVGLAYMAGPTGGYLFGFLIAAALVGWAVDRFGIKAVWFAMPLGLAAIYGAGLVWLAQFVPADKLLAFGLTPFLLGDLVKVALAAVLVAYAPAGLRRWVRN
ncbi:biotin transporter BioY [Yoonia vestfoldensis]|uniref:Biotin transporter n=1 Tax=Yoonia vestfoldensis TaxID=245188 RepID=A0A1Y0E7M9_9RHOB|nr:biotin transporter BioY [Yoonia vestfoldensis]ART99409.1 biotin transporter BioY [Yoonia vestfoldensis]